MSDNETLLAIEAIKDLKARYFRFIDTKDWSGLNRIFTQDVHVDITADAPSCILDDRDTFVAMVRDSLSRCVTVHHGHCPEITFTSDSTADGIWAMEDMLQWDDPGVSPIRSLHGYGHYRESYRRIDGEWRISSLTLSRLRVDTIGWDA